MDKKILVVDDDQFLVDLVFDKLTKSGFTVSKALDGVQALEIAQKEKLDLILLDLIMPGMDGIATLKKLKENERTKTIPVIILTNLNDDQLINQIKQFGGQGYLIKNEHNIDTIVEAVNNLI